MIAGMGYGSAVAIYFVIWWVTLFLTLPFGVRSQHEVQAVTDGTDPGAPVIAGLWAKAIVTTVLSGLIMAAFLWAKAKGVTLDDIPLINLLMP